MSRLNLINAKELHLWLTTKKPCSLVDVRDADERELCLIKGSRHIPLYDIEKVAHCCDKVSPIVFYCHHGMRSQQAAMAALQMGFTQVYSLIGGVDMWAQLIEPEMMRY